MSAQIALLEVTVLPLASQHQLTTVFRVTIALVALQLPHSMHVLLAPGVVQHPLSQQNVSMAHIPLRALPVSRVVSLIHVDTTRMHTTDIRVVLPGMYALATQPQQRLQQALVGSSALQAATVQLAQPLRLDVLLEPTNLTLDSPLASQLPLVFTPACSTPLQHYSAL